MATFQNKSDFDILDVGVVFGTFAPMHRGHLDLIMEAKKLHKHVAVVVCGYDNDRGEEVNLPLDLRVQYARELFENDEIIHVLRISDTELGLDESMSDSNWDIWVNAVMEGIRKSFKYPVGPVDVTWYVSESEYVKQLNKERLGVFASTAVLHVRTDISGTLCREHPHSYWRNIAKPFRRPFTKKILITGTASEVKSALVKDIATYFDMPYTVERGRDSCRFMTDDQFDSKVFIHNIYEQNLAINDAISSPGNNGYIISDTDNFVTLMYAMHYMQRKDFALHDDPDIIYLIRDMIKRYKEENTWDYIFVTTPHLPFVDDGTRWMPDGDINIRSLTVIEFIPLNGSYYENFITVKERIEKDMEESSLMSKNNIQNIRR